MNKEEFQAAIMNHELIDVRFRYFKRMHRKGVQILTLVTAKDKTVKDDSGNIIPNPAPIFGEKIIYGISVKRKNDNHNKNLGCMIAAKRAEDAASNIILNEDRLTAKTCPREFDSSVRMAGAIHIQDISKLIAKLRG